MSEVKKVTPQTSEEPVKAPVKKSIKSSDIVKVSNISNKALFLASGRINPGEEGKATQAELTCLAKFLKAI